MNLGDRVRMMSSTEEGIIVDFLANDMVEVEIEDGFGIPVLKKDLVLVSAVESQYFHRNNKETPVSQTADKGIKPPTKAAKISKGTYLAYIPLGKNNYELVLINNTIYDLSYRILEYHDNKYKGLSIGTLASQSTQKVTTKSSTDFEKWPVILIEALHFKEGFFDVPEMIKKRVKPKANLFQKKGLIPLIDKEGFKIQLDQFETTIDIEAIKESIDKNTTLSTPDISSSKKDNRSTVDLHAEVHGFENDNGGTILEKQLSLFNDKLDIAVLNGNEEITFIHGVGNGVLRERIHKILSGHPHVAYFKDTDKGKFGYGATLVKIK